jgi:hypothetical protein
MFPFGNILSSEAYGQLVLPATQTNILGYGFQASFVEATVRVARSGQLWRKANVSVDQINSGVSWIEDDGRTGFDTGDIFEVYATATGATLWTGSDNLDEWLPINQDRLWGMYSESIEPFPLNAVVTIQIREILNPSNISIQSVFSCSILNEAN